MSNTELQIATAILLTEIMCADHNLDDREKSLIMRILREQFHIDEEEAVDVFSVAESRCNEVVSLHEQTSMLNRYLNAQERVKLIENMWRVIYADGEMDMYEEHLLRRIVDLLYVSHADFIRTKHIVLTETC